MNHSGTLYVVATPIGNLQDITLRALDVLKAVDIIAAEDTRHTAHLLTHFGIRKSLLSVHEHNEMKSADQLISRIQHGESVALVTDAGTPGVSDPGAIVVKACHDAGVKVIPIPGPSAVVAALSAAGITTNASFTFYGFLPATSSQRKRVLETLKPLDSSLVFYEAPHRVLDCVDDLAVTLGDRPLVIARELTKTFETIHRCTLQEATAWLNEDANRQRGEFVLIVEPARPVEEPAVNEEALRVLQLLLAELPLKQSVKLTAAITGVKKNALYDLALQLQEK